MGDGDVIYSELNSSGNSNNRATPINPFNAHLNASQLGAISFALQGPSRISLIHGPPVRELVAVVYMFVSSSNSLILDRLILTD